MTFKSGQFFKAAGKWIKKATKFTAISAAISGMFTAAFSSTTVGTYAGVVLYASGAGTYAMVNGIPVKGYDRVAHVSPRPRKPDGRERGVNPFALKPNKTPKMEAMAARKRTMSRGKS